MNTELAITTDTFLEQRICCIPQVFFIMSMLLTSILLIDSNIEAMATNLTEYQNSMKVGGHLGYLQIDKNTTTALYPIRITFNNTNYTAFFSDLIPDSIIDYHYLKVSVIPLAENYSFIDEQGIQDLNAVMNNLFMRKVTKNESIWPNYGMAYTDLSPSEPPPSSTIVINEHNPLLRDQDANNVYQELLDDLAELLAKQETAVNSNYLMSDDMIRVFPRTGNFPDDIVCSYKPDSVLRITNTISIICQWRYDYLENEFSPEFNHYTEALKNFHFEMPRIKNRHGATMGIIDPEVFSRKKRSIEQSLPKFQMPTIKPNIDNLQRSADNIVNSGSTKPREVTVLKAKADNIIDQETNKIDIKLAKENLKMIGRMMRTQSTLENQERAKDMAVIDYLLRQSQGAFDVGSNRVNCTGDCVVSEVTFGKSLSRIRITANVDSTAFQKDSCIAKTSKLEFNNACSGKRALISFPDSIQCSGLNENDEFKKISGLVKPKVCYLEDDNLGFNDCKGQTIEKMRNLLVVRWKEESFVTELLNVRKTYYPKSIDSYNCSLSCADGTCTGDDIYKENFGFGTKSEYCGFQPEKYRLNLMYKDKAYEIGCYHMNTFKVRNHMKKEERIDENLIKLTCDNNGLKITNDHHKTIRFIQISHEGENLYKGINQSGVITNVKLPNSYFHQPTTSIIVITFETNDSVKKSFLCPEIKPCDLVSCIMCYERWLSYHCFSWFEWSIYIMLMIIMIFIIIVVLKFMFMMSLIVAFTLSSYCLCCRYCFFRLKKCQSTAAKVYKSKMSKMKHDMGMNEKDIELGRPLMGSHRDSRNKNIVYVKAPKPYTAGWTNNQLVIMIITLYLFIDLTSAEPSCFYSQVLVAKSRECQDKVCKIQSNVRLVLPPKGSSTCLNIMDNSDDILGYYIIETLDTGIRCSEEVLYYHPDSIIECSSYHSCRTTDLCYDDICEKTLANGTIPPLDPEFKYSGVLKCDRVCGCAGCGCFICAQSCLYTRLSYKNPTKDFLRVSRCAKWSYYHQVKITLRSSKGDDKEQITTLDLNSIENIEGVELSLVSITSPPLPNQGKCFLTRRNGKVSINDCNLVGNLIKGKVGEMQCATEESAMTISKSCFMSSDLFTIRSSSDGSVCESHLVSINKMADINKIPLISGGGVYTKEDNVINFRYGESTTMEIQLTINDLTLSKREDKTLCYAEYIEGSGCYNCRRGALIKLKLSTKTGGSVGHIYCPSSTGSALFSATSVPSDTLLSINFKLSKIRETCTVTCSAGNTSLYLSLDLIYIPTVNVVDNNQVITHPNTSGAFDIGSIFHSEWMIILYSIIGFLIILAAIYLILILLSKVRHKTA